MRYKDFKRIDTDIIVPIDIEKSMEMNNHDFMQTYIEIISKSMARKVDIDLLNKFSKLSKRKRFKIRKWLERVK